MVKTTTSIMGQGEGDKVPDLRSGRVDVRAFESNFWRIAKIAKIAPPPLFFNFNDRFPFN